MRRNTIVGCFAVIALAGGLMMHDLACPHTGKDQVYDDLGQFVGDAIFRNRDLEEKLARWDRFARVADEAERDLVAGDVSLAEAVERIHTASAELYPDFLDHLKRHEIGDTPHERIARNIIRHIQDDTDAQDLAVVQRLERELALMLKQRPKGLPGLIVSMA